MRMRFRLLPRPNLAAAHNNSWRVLLRTTMVYLAVHGWTTTFLPTARKHHIMGVVGVVSAFQPPCPITTSHKYLHYPQQLRKQLPSKRSNSPKPLCMVSQKDKRRMQESTKKRKGFEEMEVHMAQNNLALQLQDLLEGSANKKKHNVAARDTKKLLKSAQHDGLDDIGMEALLVALEIFYLANRPSDVVSLEKSSATVGADPLQVLQLNQFGLWAHAELEDWNAAVPSAYELYSSEQHGEETTPALLDSDSLFSEPGTQNRLRQYAIQAFANTDQYLPIALELLSQDLNILEAQAAADSRLPAEDATGTIVANINVLLRSHLRTVGERQAAKGLFQKMLALQEQLQKTAEDMFILDNESYGLMLDCAAIEGDIELMEEALGDKEAFYNWLGSVIAMDIVMETFVEEGVQGMDFTEQAMDDMVARNDTKRPPADKLLVLILETLAKATAAGKDLSSDQQTLAVQAIQVLKSGKGKDVKQTNPTSTIDSEILSQILVALEDESQVEIVLQACRAKATSWYDSLSDAAKVRILPTQIEFELSSAGGESSLDGDAWKILSSLVPTNKNGAISQQGRNFLRKQQSHEFCQAALYLSTENDVLAQAFVQECWQTLLSPDDPMTKWWCAHGTLSWIHTLPKESERIDLFDKMTNFLVGSPSSREGDKLDQSLSFGNAKLDLIVRQTARLLRAMAIDAVTHSDMQALKYSASKIAVTAMVLVDGLEEFSPEYVWNHGPSDNGAKEALQTIMRELLLSNLVAHDDDLVYPAYEYYLSLLRVSQSSSVIKTDELLFPFERRESFINFENSYQCFRDCILGNATKQMSAGNLLQDALFTLYEFDEADAGDLVPLLPIILDMTLKFDQRTGKHSYENTISQYKKELIEVREDILLDNELFGSLCHMFSFKRVMDESLTAVERMGPVERMKAADNPVVNAVQVLITPDLAKSLINRLQQAHDGRYWIVDKLFNGDKDHLVRISAEFLVSLYAQADCFEKILDDENSKSLGEAYIEACGQNCGLLVWGCTGNRAVTSENTKSLGRRGRSTRRGKAPDNERRAPDRETFAFVLHGFFRYMSKAVAEIPWELSFETLVKHALNCFSHNQPKGYTDEDLESVLSPLISDELLDPNVQARIRCWLEISLKDDDEEEGDEEEGDEGQRGSLPT